VLNVEISCAVVMESAQVASETLLKHSSEERLRSSRVGNGKLLDIAEQRFTVMLFTLCPSLDWFKKHVLFV